MGPEGGKLGRPTQAVRHTCSGILGIVKIYVILGRTGTMRLQQTRKKTLAGIEDAPMANGDLCFSTMVNPALHKLKH